MKKRVFKICSRTGLACLEALAVVFVLVFIACGLLIWRLVSGSVEIGFAKSYIEQALYDPVSGYSVTLENVSLNWPDLQGPIMLEVQGVSLFKEGIAALRVESASLGLSTRHLFIGDIEPVRIVLQRPSLKLIRTEDNKIRLDLDDAASPEPEQDTENPMMRMIEMLSRPSGSVDKRSPLDNLQNIEIKDAKLAVADYRAGMTWYLLPINLGFARNEGGLTVTASAAFPGGRDKASHLQAEVAYLRERENFSASIHVQDFDPHVISKKIDQLSWLNDQNIIFNGDLNFSFDSSFNVHKASVALSSAGGALFLKGVYDEPLPFEELSLDAVYDSDLGLADLRNLTMTSKGVSFSVSTPVKIEKDIFKAPVTISISDFAQAQIAPLWPDALRGDGSEIWLTEKLSKGRFHGIQANFDIGVQKNADIWAVDVDNITADFQIEEMDIDYRAPLAPVEKASGKGRFEKDVLTIDIEKGEVGGLAVKKGKVVLDHVIEGKGHANISVDMAGSMQNVLKLIQPEPISISEEKLGLKVEDVRGQTDIAVKVSFPTVKDLLAKDVIVGVEGTLSDVLLPDVVGTLDLTGGPLSLKVSDGAAQIRGKAKLQGQDIQFEWKEYLDPKGKDFVSQVRAEMIADKTLRDGLGIGLDEWIEGAFPVKVTYTSHENGDSLVDVAADLSTGSLMITPFGYKKISGVPGSASCQVFFKNGDVQEVQNLQIQVQDESRLHIGKAKFSFDSKGTEAVLRDGELPEFSLAENRLSIDFEKGQSGLLKMSVKGSFFDARPFLEGRKKKEPYAGPPLLVSIAADRMRTHAEHVIGNAKIYLDMSRQGDVNRLEMDAVAGKGVIYLRLKPDEKGIMEVRLEADDAGAALKAFDTYQNIKGGKLRIYGRADNVASRKLLHGTAEITDFYVVNAPVLAQLVSVISLLNIQELLSGEGIYFTRLESKFDWSIRFEGDRYVIREGRTSGSSLGLTFDGSVDKGSDMIRMEGTLVPVSMINEMISAIPLVGDILTGGGGGIIAATYKVEGPVKKPEVSVNPLSALAPGILRTILFE